jgi:hypothetical protein
MPTTRRAFLGRAAAGAAIIGALPSDLFAAGSAEPAAVQDGKWDLTWVNRITGKHRAIFDVPEVESGYGVWRLNAWANQYQQVLGAKPAEITGVLVLHHNGIVLAMQQAFWDKYGIGKAKNVTHPLTTQPTDKNPALLGAKDGVPEPFASGSLPSQLQRGAIVLACNLALQDCVELIKAKDQVSDEAAHKLAVAMLVPGVVLQPSGVFAAVRAQQTGCAYVRAS